MSTIFNKDENVYYPYYIPNISPNLIIDLEPKQDIIVTNDLIKYFNENIKSENVVNKSMTNPGWFSNPTVKLIKLSKLTNSSKTELNSICLKPKIPGNIQIVNIKPNKTYTINPLNIVAYSSNIDFKIISNDGEASFSKNLLNMIEVNQKKVSFFWYHMVILMKIILINYHIYIWVS